MKGWPISIQFIFGGQNCRQQVRFSGHMSAEILSDMVTKSEESKQTKQDCSTSNEGKESQQNLERSSEMGQPFIHFIVKPTRRRQEEDKHISFMTQSTRKVREMFTWISDEKYLKTQVYHTLLDSFLYFFRIRSVQALPNIDWTDRLKLNEKWWFYEVVLT